MRENDRQKILERDGLCCQECGASELLHVHHIKPRSEGGTDDPDNLTTLCRPCHVDLHRQVDKAYWAEINAYNDAYKAALNQVQWDYIVQGGRFEDFAAWAKFQREWDGWPEQPY